MKCKACKCRLENKGKHTGTCSNDKFVYTDVEKTPIDGSGYWDYESYQAGFETGEDFGCIHFSPI